MRSVSATALALAVLGRIGASQQAQVTLPEAVQRALAAQPAVVQARGAVTNAAWQKRAAYGAFVPTLSVSSSALRQNNPSIVNGIALGGGGYQYSSGLTASLDLFAGFRRIANFRGANAAQDAADAGLINQRYQVAATTAQVFFTATAAEELVRVSQAQLQAAKQALQISLNKFQAGAAIRSDTLTSTVDYGNAQIALLQAQANLATAQANLARQIGTDSLVRAVADSQLPPLPDTTGLRAAAIEAAPAVVQAEASERVASASLSSARSLYWPTITTAYLTSSQGFTEPWHGFEAGNHNVNQFRIGLSWTLFNGFQREQTTAASGVDVQVARAQAADTRRLLSAQLTEQLAVVFTGYSQIAIATANVAAAAEALRVQQERYRVGAAILLDLLTAEASLTQASEAQVQARYNYLIARAQVEALVGHPL